MQHEPSEDSILKSLLREKQSRERELENKQNSLEKYRFELPTHDAEVQIVHLARIEKLEKAIEKLRKDIESAEARIADRKSAVDVNRSNNTFHKDLAVSETDEADIERKIIDAEVSRIHNSSVRDIERKLRIETKFWENGSPPLLESDSNYTASYFTKCWEKLNSLSSSLTTNTDKNRTLTELEGQVLRVMELINTPIHYRALISEDRKVREIQSHQDVTPIAESMNPILLEVSQAIDDAKKTIEKIRLQEVQGGQQPRFYVEQLNKKTANLQLQSLALLKNRIDEFVTEARMER